MARSRNATKPNRAARPGSAAPKQRTSRVSVPRQRLSAYALALTSPFDKGALGARVPDLFSAPTITGCVSRSWPVMADSSGNFASIVIPNPSYQMYASQGTIPNGSNWSTFRNTTPLAEGSARVEPEDVAEGCRLTNYRIVGMGVRLKGNTSMTNSSGTITMGKVIPRKGITVPDISADVGQAQGTNPLASRAAFFDNLGVPYQHADDLAKIDISAISSLPDKVSVSGMSLNEDGLLARMKPVSSEAFEFRSVKNSNYGTDIDITSGTGAIYLGDGSFSLMDGYEVLVIGGTGLPASTTFATLEVIYHLEGSPGLAISGATSSSRAATHVKMSEFFQTMDTIANAASFVPPLVGVANAYRAGRALM